MKKTMLALVILLAANTGSSAQDSTHKSGTHQHKMTKSKGVKYTCTMHPEVVMDNPGKCPKCGMTLVKMKQGKNSKKKGDMKDMKM